MAKNKKGKDKKCKRKKKRTMKWIVSLASCMPPIVA